MTKPKERRKDMESSLSSHKHHKKELIPPLLQIPKLAHSPWIHDRLPEMFWSVLVINSLERTKALEFFRYVSSYVSTNTEFFDISLTGIGKLPSDKVESFINYLLDWSEEIPVILRPLRLYPEIPASEVWGRLLKDPIPNEDWEKVHGAILKTFNHQSQESTDCRWVKILCFMQGDMLKFPEGFENMQKEILQYPNYGDMQKVRSMIRALEITLRRNEDLTWPYFFWTHNYESTDCVPEEICNNKIKSRKENLSKELKNTRNHFVNETIRLRKDLITHFFECVQDTRVDTRRETSFGLALYGLTLFTEIIFYSVSSSITGRVALRSLIETYITFEYLLKKEKEESKIWDDFYSYGTGQNKLIYLKLKEISKKSNYIDLDDLSTILNEDLHVEFIPINLGQWGSSDLRRMSEFAGVKETYDLYYNYASGFVHGTRGAIRESVYQRCLNPLHRFHRIPLFDLSLMPSITLDSIEIVNKMLDCLNTAYPSFNSRIKLPESKKIRS